MSDAQVAKFIFHPGFSTAAKVTSVSGRGVGMDVVKTNIELIGGTVDIRSEQGRGTTFTIKIPLTLAIVAALIVSSKDQRFAIPQVAVSELVRVSPASEHSIERINGTPILRLRDRLLPIVPLSKVMGLSGNEEADTGFVVVTQVAHQRFGILVDGVFHTEEIVVKPMSSKLRHIQLFSGNTILGDGAVVLIIDPNGLARMVGSEASSNELQNDASQEQAAVSEDEMTSLLVFRGGGESLKAVPLSLVTRLEEIDASTIEWSSGRPVVQYRGRLMPLVSCDEELAIKRQGMQSLLVFSDGDVSMGLAVAEIVDIVEDKLDVELLAERSDLVGSAVVRGRTTEIVNVAHYLPMVLESWSRKDRRNSSNKSLLLVDSSTFFRDMLVPVLKASGYRVQTASTAQEAVHLLSSGLQVDVVVTDLELSSHSGFALVASLRADPQHNATPVIGMTVKPDPQQIAFARNSASQRLCRRSIVGVCCLLWPSLIRRLKRLHNHEIVRTNCCSNQNDIQAYGVRNGYCGRAAAWPADQPGPRCLRRQRDDDSSLGTRRDGRTSQSARSSRYGRISPPPSRFRRYNRRGAPDGGWTREPRRSLWPARG